MVPGDYNGARILIVDDEESNVLLLERMLGRAGYTHLTSTRDSRLALQLVEETCPDLILLDLMMPNLDGYGVMAQISEHLSPEVYLPILVLTADVTPQALQRALSGGARDFLTKPFDQTELLLRVRNLLETRFLYLGLQQQLQRLEELNDEARSAILFRDESLSSISHDMGQPLAAVRLTVEMLQELIRDTDVPDKQELAEDLERIVLASSQMAGMIGEMSDTARLQMGRELVLQRRRFDLVALANNQVLAARPAVGRHRLYVDTHVPELFGEWDQVRLTRVLSNLLSNAIKFSPSGGDVIVTIDAEPDRAVVSVSDHGLGIPEADLPHVFDSFYRASNVLNSVTGTGVGLASARQIVEQHGGSIDVESIEGRGTTVKLSLPLT
ncbi:MAG TPA: ATP-binding protein [Dehalococcoidia bacterium]|nr:ATP-binding protein [Dehalococcoidia bacterium]